MRTIIKVSVRFRKVRYLICGMLTIVTCLSGSGQGTCISGDCINGNGTYEFPSGSVFEGSFRDGKMVKGDFRFVNGDVYSGSFLNNRFHGQGVYQYKKSGNTFKGLYEHGEKISGTFTYNDGSSYAGAFKNHKKDGRGKLITSSGKVFDGFWEADMFIGIEPGNSVQTYAVIVGVADYKHFRPGTGDLRFTVTDAQKFNNFLQSPKGGRVPASNIKLLLNSQATHASILEAGRQMFAKADENDRIVFFFSGHGSETGFLPYDVNNRGNPMLEHDQVKALFAASKASAKLIFADACHSGSIRKEVTTSAPADVLASLGIKSTLPQSNRRNVAIMLSSAGDQISFEYPSINQGVFSYYLIDGLSGAADKNHDNLITIAETYYYVRDNTYNFVRENVGYTQTPVLFGNFDKEMIIAVY
ncbi:MAG TPA: hypothetical protein DF409_16490 [Bacteroidales bacterium]|nr:hypothetical protein [Bacteroidales bacterium]